MQALWSWEDCHMGHQTRLASRPPGGTEFEQPVSFEDQGVGTIPEARRRSTPVTYAVVCLGASLCLGSVVYGWLPRTFGLGFWAAVSSVAVGTLIGLVPMAPLILIGSATATNNATASGGAFGVRGRLIGSGLGLALMLLSMALAIW